jgi:steroid delta-isomerase
MSDEPAKRAVSAYLAALEARDVEGVLALLHDDIVQVDPYPSAPNVGKAAVRAFFEQSFAMAERMDVTVGTVIVNADRVVFPFTVRSTLAGGAALDVDIVDVMSVDDGGLITSITAYVDMAGARAV